MKNMKSALMLGFNPKAERHKEDYYATSPKALELFLDNLKDLTLNNNIWEVGMWGGGI